MDDDYEVEIIANSPPSFVDLLMSDEMEDIESNLDQADTWSEKRKKFVIVSFVEDKSRIEYVPSSWMLDSSRLRLPNTSTLLMKFVRDGTPPSKSWKIYPVRILYTSNSQTKAEKLTEALLDSESLSPTLLRVRKKPKRFSDFSFEELEVKNTSYPSNFYYQNSSNSTLSKSSMRNGLQCIDSSTSSLKENDPLLTQVDDLASLACSNKIIPMLVKLQTSVDHGFRNVTKRLDRLETRISLLEGVTQCEDVTELFAKFRPSYQLDQLPIDSYDQLQEFDKSLLANVEMINELIRHLTNVEARNPYKTFINMLRLVLTQQLAMKFSIYGRKGKEKMSELKLYNIILAAAKKKFPQLSEIDLSREMGKALANAIDWNGRSKKKG